MKIVISQPMFLPWVGLFEQIELADIYVHYDDASLPQGRSFMSRVQMKGANGIFWLTAPIDKARSQQPIHQCYYQAGSDWRKRHVRTITHCLTSAPHFQEVSRLLDEIYSFENDNLAAFNQNAIEAIARFLHINTTFKNASDMQVMGSGTHKLVDICAALEGTRYITGHGAANYMDHSLFAQREVSVEYMNYQKIPYNQFYGDFTPFVSVIDAIAHLGESARNLLQSGTVPWKEFKSGTT